MEAAPDNGIQDPQLATLYIYTYEHIKIYKKANFEITESDRYDLTISKWTVFYQELEDTVSTLGFK